MGMGLALLFALGATQTTVEPASEEAGVRTTISLYLEGQATGNADYYRQAFHPDARLSGVRDGKSEQGSLAEYLAMQSGKPAPDEARRKRTVERVIVTGDAAIASIVLDYPRALTADHMSLIRAVGRWLIIHKLYNVASKPRP